MIELALAARFASSLGVAVALYSLAGTGICAAAVVLLREALLRRERRERLADADDAEIRDLLEETQHPAGGGEIPDRDAT